MPEPEKNLQLDRLVFFTDAIVAIAITLLALNIHVNIGPDGHLHYSDLLRQWKHFLAFGLSFFNIAVFWKTHHTFFGYIRKIDDRMIWCTIFWLLFIVVLPFSTSLVSEYFFDIPAMVCYSINILMIAIFQNAIWDYAAMKPNFMKEDMSIEWNGRIRMYCNLDMINAGIGLIAAFYIPVLAFIILFTRFPAILITGIYYTAKNKKELRKKKP
ncbi:TMEM175 family protein [Flavobacterium silvaticum]|uniref:DUF1211 domain-containing protein n=1 Tax=Flavobacterium silvaticum TaxID=1852020 RepID=A0A972G0W6_9FLAO|nr:TMEM175 family protein [Flavobacterium silvaticum]NMH28401.1 DUF1211 domain-containing protein [Flavobacterium silvaticum]